MEQATTREKPFLAIQRHFPVAPEKVWRAWTDPEALRRWFGPGTVQEPVAAAELDVRVGGRFRLVFGGPKGDEHEAQGVYKEVVPNRKLVFTWTWPRTTPERESVITITLKASGGGTDFDFRQEQFFNEAVRDGHLGGWTSTFAKLERVVQEL
ncbi:MAG TPA: SRPBCC domain-containing protein [Burkholderiales bacterium]|nr:SRPBCC domain-containing protein [Burkholderiales bacterium]